MKLIKLYDKNAYSKRDFLGYATEDDLKLAMLYLCDGLHCIQVAKLFYIAGFGLRMSRALVIMAMSELDPSHNREESLPSWQTR